jgi:dTDP-4-dehydrorhamnose reductase
MTSFQAAAIIGADGMLGSDLRAAIEKSGAFGRLFCAQLPDIDITSPASVREFLEEARPEVVFNCAAYTNVDDCEERPEFAFAVNAAGAGHVAEAAARLGALMVHLSTDYVFDGEKDDPYTEEDAPNPLSVYARSKLEGERLVMRSAGTRLIVRTGWLYGRHRWNLVDRVLRMCRYGEELMGASDLTGSPTWARDLAEALVLLALRRAEGFYHVVNQGACTRLEQVKAIVEGTGLTREVKPVSATEFPRPARVPRYSALSVNKFEAETGRRMRPWREALLEYVRTESPERAPRDPV